MQKIVPEGMRKVSPSEALRRDAKGLLGIGVIVVGVFTLLLGSLEGSNYYIGFGIGTTLWLMWFVLTTVLETFSTWQCMTCGGLVGKGAFARNKANPRQNHCPTCFTEMPQS